MAHYDIFRHHLSIKFPAYGHALWDPDPGNLSPAVEVGDVGYIYEGKFHRLFNVLLPADHPSHRNFGVPEYHEQLTLDMENHINSSNLSPNNFCSAKVTSMPVSERLAKGPDEIPKVSYSCPMKEGAVLCLPVKAKGENTVARTKFGRWIIKNIDRWFAWARLLELGVERMEDIILVTGTHRTRSWTNAIFPGGQADSHALFGSEADHRDGVVSVHWQFSHEHNRGVVLNCGPDGEDLPEDQCIFIRGFRAARRFKILPPRLKGAAGPNPDPEGDDEGSDAKLIPIPATIPEVKPPPEEDDEVSDAELIPIPAIPEYRDPVHILLEYIAEAAPRDCDMVLVHDDDLVPFVRIYDSTPIDTLKPYLMLNRTQGLKPVLHCTLIDLPRAHDSASPGSYSDPDSALVATLPNHFKEQSSPSPSSSPSASQSPSPQGKTTSIQRRTDAGCISGDPVRDLNNYLQNRNLTPGFTWVLRQSGPSHEATHHVTAKLRGSDIGHGKGPSVGMARKEAAIRALQHLKTAGI